MSSLLIIFLIICVIGGIWIVWRWVRYFDTNGTYKKRPRRNGTAPDDLRYPNDSDDTVPVDDSDDTVYIDPDGANTSFTGPRRRK